jgi:hypothetical protein
MSFPPLNPLIISFGSEFLFNFHPSIFSRTLAAQTGMTLKWLKDQGLLSVKELWVYPVE